MDLTEFRKRLDAIDGQLIELFRERMEISRAVAEYKASKGLPTFDPVREAVKLDAVEAALPEELGPYGRELFQKIMDLGKDYQNGLRGRSAGEAGSASPSFNIVLIGMPGSGKTRVAALLSSYTGLPYVDCDAALTERAGRSIPEIFAQDGEEAFRDMETEILRELCAGSGKIVSTGGGCVVRAENYGILKENGIIVWIRRDLDRLELVGRPISLSKSPEILYAERKDKYKRFSDIEVSNDGDPADAALKVIGLLGLRT